MFPNSSTLHFHLFADHIGWRKWGWLYWPHYWIFWGDWPLSVFYLPLVLPSWGYGMYWLFSFFFLSPTRNIIECYLFAGYQFLGVHRCWWPKAWSQTCFSFWGKEWQCARLHHLKSQDSPCWSKCKFSCSDLSCLVMHIKFLTKVVSLS